MRQSLNLAACAAAVVMFIASAVEAQVPVDWSASIDEVTSGFSTDAKLRFLIATPTNSPLELEAAGALQRRLLDGKYSAVVMDDSPMGDIAGLSDEEIVARAKVYPVDVIAIVRAFPGAEGATVMVRLEMEGEPTRVVALQTGEAVAPVTPTASAEPQPTVSATPPASAKPKPTAPAAVEPTPAEVPATTEPAAVVATPEPPRVLTIDPWVFEEDGSFGHVTQGAATIPWPTVYEELGPEDDLGSKYRRRRAARTVSFVSGGTLAAVGAGLLYVSLLSSTDCAECRNDTMLGVGIGALTAGAIGAFIGFLIEPHPVDRETMPELIDARNERVGNSD